MPYNKSLAAEFESKEVVPTKFAGEVGLSISRVAVRFAVGGVTRATPDYDRLSLTDLALYDTDKNGCIEKTELDTGNNLRLQQILRRWDANNDGRIFADEIKADYVRQQAALTSQVFATATGRFPSLFSMLDVSGDNRLSLREMRTAGQLLRSFDRNGDSHFGFDEMPGEITLLFDRGNNDGSPQVSKRNRRDAGRPRSAGPLMPKWFVRMDRNRDGDISPREFIGSREKFRTIDTNNDGFIEPGEAEAVGK